MTWQNNFVDLLKGEFAKLQKKNSRYSYRAFAKKIRLSQGPLYDLMNNKARWMLKEERAIQIMETLKINRSGKNRVLMAMARPLDLNVQTLDPDDYHRLTDWTFIPILAALDLPSRERTIGAISKRLGLAHEKVAEVLNDLVLRGLAVHDEMGGVSRQKTVLRSTDSIPSKYIRRHHELNLSLAARALENVPMNMRDFTSQTFVGSAQELENLRREIRALHEKCMVLAERGDENDTVFRLSIQLFPMENGNA